MTPKPYASTLINTDFKELEHHVIEKGLSKILSEFSNSPISPLSKNGAIFSPNHTTGITITESRIIVSLSFFTI